MRRLFAALLASAPFAGVAPAADPAPEGGLDLSGVTLTKLYEADFSAPLRFVKEEDLLQGDERVRGPGDAEWVLEGGASARTEDGRLHLANEGGHLVCWNTRPFPGDFLLEFGVVPRDSNRGLNIVFFCAAARGGGGIFDLGQPRRGGEFKNYHSGEIDCYHASYWATQRDGTARGTAHLRKNHGFHLVAEGPDLIAGAGSDPAGPGPAGPVPHRVRLLKLGGGIAVEVNGRVSLRWSDDGAALGPALRDGLVGLRQMEHSGSCAYTHFRVWSAATTPPSAKSRPAGAPPSATRRG